MNTDRNPIGIEDGPWRPQRRDVVRPSLSPAELRRELRESMKRRGQDAPRKPYQRTSPPLYERREGEGELSKAQRFLGALKGVAARKPRSAANRCQCGANKNHNAQMCWQCRYGRPRP